MPVFISVNRNVLLDVIVVKRKSGEMLQAALDSVLEKNTSQWKDIF